MISLKKSKNVWNYKGRLLDRHGKNYTQSSIRTEQKFL